MREQLGKRLQELKAEFEKGHKQLAEAEAQATTIRNTLLRINGAIQVLEEELAKTRPSKNDASHLETQEVS